MLKFIVKPYAEVNLGSKGLGCWYKPELLQQNISHILSLQMQLTLSATNSTKMQSLDVVFDSVTKNQKLKYTVTCECPCMSKCMSLSCQIKIELWCSFYGSVITLFCQEMCERFSMVKTMDVI